MRSVPKSLLWAWAVATAALYGVLAYGSYVTLPFLARGTLGFDMRPLGMPVDEAESYLTDMWWRAGVYYTDVLRPLDTAFIAALSVLAIAVAMRLGGRLAVPSIVFALAYAGADLLENYYVGLVMAPGSTSTGDWPIDLGLITIATRTKFATLILMALFLLIQWRRSHAQR